MTSLFLPLHENGGKQWLKVNANRNKVTAMQKKRVGLLFRFGVIVLILIIVTLTISGIATYKN